MEPFLRRALEEDLGLAGDLTTDTIVPADLKAEGVIAARDDGRVAGLVLAATTFRLLDKVAQVEALLPDGSDAEPGAVLARVSTNARALLTGERTALNLLGRLSGIATVTRNITRSVEAAFEGRSERPPHIVCTRKTTPGLRALEKYAVRCGGGHNHRFGLHDAVLIKDNHIALAGGVRTAVERARAGVGHMVRIQLEVDTLDQLELALELGVDAVLLDNMSLEQLRRAVSLVDGRALTEASGGVTPETAPDIARTGVDQISIGWLTHSAPTLDVGLDIHT